MHRFMRGFTLIEMVVAIVIVGLITAVGGHVLAQAFRNYFTARDMADATWQARLALERMTRDLREIRSATGTDLSTLGASQIVFNDAQGIAVNYSYNAATNELMRNAQPIAGDVAGVALAYLDGAGTATATAAQVRYITVTLTVTRSAVTRIYRSTVAPRNFP